MAVIDLAEIASSKSLPQMQPFLERAKKSDLNFIRIGLINKQALSTAFFPLVDEMGHSNIGKSFADRPFIPKLQKALKPLLSEVVMGKIGHSVPLVSVIAPVVIHGTYGGYVAGILQLSQLSDVLKITADENNLLYSLIDKNNNTILTNRPDQKMMTPFVRAKGKLISLDHGILQWIPLVPPNTPTSEQWKKSFYITESLIGDLAEWKLILEQPIAPFQKRLYNQYSGELVIVLFILVIALLLVEILSRMVVKTLGQLGVMTNELPLRLTAEGENMIWPTSEILELDTLINNFKRMVTALSGQFNEVHQINQSLEQRVAERTMELKASQEVYRTIVEQTECLITKVDQKRCFLYVNGLGEKIYGKKSNELEGLPTSQFIHPDDQARVSMWFNECVLLKLSKSSIESRQVNSATGEVFHLLWNTNFFYDEKGQVKYSNNIASNITERKLLEETLRMTRVSVDAASDALFWMTRDARIVDVNVAACRALGHTREELLQLRVPDLDPNYNDKIWPQHFIDLKKHGTLKFETEHRRKDGTIFPVEIVANYVCLGTEECNCAFVRDITERKKSEKVLNKTQALLLAAIKHAPIYTYIKEVTSTESRTLYASDNFLQMIGIPSDQMIGKTMSELFPLELATKMTKDDWNIISKGVVQEFEEKLNGRQYRSIKFPIVFGNKSFLGGYTIDITENKQIEDDLLQAKIAAESANRAKSKFLANMSHELRSPLNGVLGFAQILAMNDLSPTQKEYVNYILQSGKNLLELINDILDFSKVEAEKIELENTALNVKTIIEEIISTHKLKAIEKNLSLNMKISSDLDKSYMGDPFRPKQILNNLVSNALKFSQIGGVKILANFISKKEGFDIVQFLVSDTGIGMSPETLEIIFKPFVQANSGISREYGGTGLGLVISKKLVELMGGRLLFESALGIGSTFYFEIPLLKSNVVESGNEKIENYVMNPQFKNLSVLLVEDNLTNLNLGIAFLGAFGCKVKAVERATDALELLEKEKFDLLLVDILMPGMSGIEMINLIREKEASSKNHQVTIALTANALQSDKEQCLQVGFDGYVPKPIEFDVLAEEMKRVLTTPLPKLNILVVDDSFDNRLSIKIFLENTNCQITEAENGKIAVEKVKQELFDVVLMDIQMPVMDGYSATHEIRKWEQQNVQQQIPIIAFSASSSREDRERTLAAGFNEILSKPFSFEDLVKILKKYC